MLDEEFEEKHAHEKRCILAKHAEAMRLVAMYR